MGKDAMGREIDQWGVPINTLYNSAAQTAQPSVQAPSVQVPAVQAPAAGSNFLSGTGKGTASLGGTPFMSNQVKMPDGSMQTNQGWGNMAMSAVGTGVNAYLGFKGLDLAEETLDFQKDSWERRFAMMQDQYYRKLNDRRAKDALVQGKGDWNDIREHYDSGTNIEGEYNPNATAPASQSGFAPTAENGRMMNLAQSGSPVSAAGAYDMMKNPNSTITNVSNSGFAGSGLRNQTPVTSADAAVSNTQIGPMGKPKKKKKKNDPERSGSNNAEQTS